MGWKNIKEHYRIGHQVQVTKQGICIGSPYIHDIIVIGLDGAVKKRYDSGRTNEDLRRYQSEMDADPDRLRQLIQSPDTFGEPVVVYTYADADIIEKQCEELGWPNVTFDGEMMYENTFSTDKNQVVEWAKNSAKIGVKTWTRQVQEANERLLFCQARLKAEEDFVTKLESLYPTVEQGNDHCRSL